MIDRPIPEELREICEEAGGEELLGGNLRIYPLESDDPDELSVATASDMLRASEWPVPDQLVVFGDNGQGDHFGVWAPREGGARPIVVQIGEVFEDACMAVVGDDVGSFLVGWGCYYALLLGDTDSLREIAPELPEELSSLEDDGSDDELYALLAWASPGLPDPRPDPYERGLTAAQVDTIARSNGR
jgi:SMI1/KNR4 family protein SUKH-1